MINNGYIKLHRSLLRNPVVMKDSDHLAVWTYILLQATFSGDASVMFAGKRYQLAAGEFTTGRKQIATDLHISEAKVQRILKLFEDEGQIEQKTDRQCRLITVTNWNKYQNHGEQRKNGGFAWDATDPEILLLKSEQRVNNGFEGISSVSMANLPKSEQRNEQRKKRGNGCATTLSDVDTMQSEQRNEQRVNNDRTTSEQRVNTKEERKECNNVNNVQECIDNTPDNKNMSSAMKRVIEYRKQIERIKQ